MSQVVLRVSKLKSKTQIATVQAHNSRTDGYQHVSSSAQKPIALVGSGDLNTAVNLRIGTQKIRKNAVLAVEIIISASPDYFRPNNPSEWGKYDPKRLSAWQVAQIKFLTDTFGNDNLISLSLHLDEATPHVHAIIVPIRPTDGKLAASHWFDGPVKMRILQDAAAKAVAHIGIRRGTAWSSAEHQDQVAFYQMAGCPVPTLPPITTKKPRPLADASFRERLPGTDAKLARDALEERHRKLTQRGASEIRARQKAMIDAYPILIEQAKKAGYLEQRLKRANDRLDHFKKTVETLKEKLRQFAGLDFARVLKEVYNARQSVSQVHGDETSFHVIGDMQINVNDNKWHDNAYPKKAGSSAVDLVMYLSDTDVAGSVNTLREYFGEAATRASLIERIEDRADKFMESTPIVPPPIMPASQRHWPDTRLRFIEDHRLPEIVVDWLHSVNGIFVNKLSQTIFPRELAGYVLTEPNSPNFHRIVGRGEQCGGYVLEGSGDVYIVDTPISAICVKAKIKNAHVIATLGANGIRPDQAKIPHERKVHIAFGNHSTGHAAAAIWMRHFAGADRVLPVSETWIEDVRLCHAVIDVEWSDQDKCEIEPEPLRPTA